MLSGVNSVKSRKVLPLAPNLFRKSANSSLVENNPSEEEEVVWADSAVACDIGLFVADE